MLILTIHGTAYAVTRLPVPAEYRAAYRLTKGTGEGYDCAQDRRGNITCECADYIFRRREEDGSLCKHTLALVECGLFTTAQPVREYSHIAPIVDSTFAEPLTY